MRSKIVILLAVFSNLIEAGPVRQHGRLMQHNKAPRFFNASAIATNVDIQTSTPITISSTSSSATTDVLTYSSTLPPLNQGSSTATLDGGSSSTTSNTASTSPTQTTVASIPSTSNAPSTPSFVAPPVVENDASRAQNSASASLASSTAAVVEIPAKNTYQFAAVTVTSTTSGAPKPSSTVIYPNAQNGNAAMASGFNQIYKTLSETSSCDAGNTNEAFSCISGELAQCQGDGTYVLKSCPQGQSCYALPLLSDQRGIFVECAVPSDAASKLAALPSTTSSAVSATSQATSAIQTSTAHSPENVQGGFVVGGFNTLTTTSVQPEVQRTASLPPVEADSNRQAETSTSQPSMTTAPVRTADQTFVTSTTSQTAAPTTTAAQAAKAEAADQSALQAATSTPTTTASQVAVARPVDQFSASQAASISQPVDQSSTLQTTSEASPITIAEQASNAKPKDQPSVTKTTTEHSASTALSGPLFSVLTADSSSALNAQPSKPTATSILQVPAAAKDTPENPPTQTKDAQSVGITIVPLTTPSANSNNNNSPGNNNNQPSNNNPGGNLKDKLVAAGSPGYTPIYITVTTTVTTTAHDAIATA